MKKGTLLLGLILTLVLLNGCKGVGLKKYSVTTYGQDPNFSVITMKTYDPASEEFTFRYDAREWTLEEWPSDDAPNTVALVHVNSDDKYKCVLLPGTIGQGLDQGNQAIEGSLLTQRYVGRTIDIYNPIGIHLVHVVGYEVEGVPYIFETRLPSKDPAACEIASQAVVSSFDVTGATAAQAETDDPAAAPVSEPTEPASAPELAPENVPADADEPAIEPAS